MLNGIVRIGAVNCQDDYALCRQQNIHSYPSLVFYGPDGVVRYQGNREQDDLIEFVGEQLPDMTVRLRTANFKKEVFQEGVPDADLKTPWVIMFCIDDDFKCPEKQQRLLLSKMVFGMVNLGK